jgi:macrolide transport system ATP-binding/permease protein
VTHNADIAASTDRIVTMRDGLIISDEPAQAVATASAQTLSRQRDADRPASARLGASWAFAVMILAAAAQAIMRNKLRSILTMLGIFIGVAALIAMVAVGQGANAAVEKEIESLGTNLLIVLPGSTTANGVRGGHGSASTLTVDDALAIPHQAPAV